MFYINNPLQISYQQLQQCMGKIAGCARYRITQF